MDSKFIIVIFLLLFILGFAIFMIVKTSKNKKQGNQIMLQKMQNNNASFNCLFKHFYGLPLAEGTQVNCYWCNDKVIFEGSGTSFNLGFSKLIDISLTTDVDIQKSYVSSIGNAVAGAVMFGVLGAIIGGRAKEKTSKTVTYYLIFTYLDNNELKYIALEPLIPSESNKFITAFKQIRPQNQSFNL